MIQIGRKPLRIVARLAGGTTRNERCALRWNNSERGTASKRCKDAGERLIKVMKKHEKDHYKVGGIEAWIDHGTEKAKAKIVGDYVE